MATGDQNDFVARLGMTLPLHWFPDTAPVLSALLNGIASGAAFVYGLIQYARLQTRIKTATDGWLDLISADFFATHFPRRAGEMDNAFRARILLELFRPRATRGAVIRVLQDLTGRTPVVFEPARPADTGAYGTLQSGLSGCLSTCGYGLAGGYGSLLLPYQAFVTAFTPLSSGIPYVTGYGQPSIGGGVGGYGAGAMEYGDLAMIVGALTAADIYAAVDSVKPVATILWTRIAAGAAPIGQVLDIGTVGGSPFE